MTARPTLERLAVARVAAGREWAWLRPILLALRPKPMPGLGTVAVTADWQLLYDDEAVVRWSDDELAAVMSHEAWHIVLRHASRRGSRDPERWNFAADAAINVEPLASRLPGGCVTAASLGLPAGLTAEQMYDRIASKPEANGHVGHGRCGGAAGGEEPPQATGRGQGNANDQADGQANGNDQGQADGSGQADANDQANGQANGNDQGGHGQADEGVPASVREAVLREAAKIAAAAGRHDVAEVAAGPKADGRVDWRTLLRRLVGQAHGRLDPTWQRRNRCQAAAGESGPRLVSYRPAAGKVVVLIDSSGSIQTDALRWAADQVGRIAAAGGNAVVVIVHDDHVRWQSEWRKGLEIRLLGRGGTDFRPAFEAAALVRPDVIIAITDCDGPMPQRAPACPVIWVVFRRPLAPPRFGRILVVEAPPS